MIIEYVNDYSTEPVRERRREQTQPSLSMSGLANSTEEHQPRSGLANSNEERPGLQNPENLIFDEFTT